ncbi:hypothetical protein B0H11DRAFT_1908441 [Mycena galericulata]|nr:hypothetical protein B0H11DRAFT_1908441 [Mycena galericulata]
MNPPAHEDPIQRRESVLPCCFLSLLDPSHHLSACNACLNVLRMQIPLGLRLCWNSIRLPGNPTDSDTNPVPPWVLIIDTELIPSLVPRATPGALSGGGQIVHSSWPVPVSFPNKIILRRLAYIFGWSRTTGSLRCASLIGAVLTTEWETRLGVRRESLSGIKPHLAFETYPKTNSELTLTGLSLENGGRGKNYEEVPYICLRVESNHRVFQYAWVTKEVKKGMESNHRHRLSEMFQEKKWKGAGAILNEDSSSAESIQVNDMRTNIAESKDFRQLIPYGNCSTAGQKSALVRRRPSGGFEPPTLSAALIEGDRAAHSSIKTSLL